MVDVILAHFQDDLGGPLDDLDLLVPVDVDTSLPFVFAVEGDFEHFVVLVSEGFGVLDFMAEPKQGGL